MNFRTFFEGINLRKLFVSFLFTISFVSFLNYFIWEVKFSAFNNYNHLYNSILSVFPPTNISNANNSLNLPIEKSSFDDRLTIYTNEFRN